MESALEVVGVTKDFGRKRAVEDLNLIVPRGSIYGFIGPSGAGKTTAIRMIMSILFPDSGTLRVLGFASALQAKDRIGYLPEERGAYRKMKVGAFLAYLGKLKNVPRDEVESRAARLLTRLGLEDVEQKRCEDLSKGMLQRVQFVGAIINQPDLLILDEPFSGLDPVSVKLLRGVIDDEHERGATILFSTHVMSHAEEMCQHVVMIHQGRKVLDEPMTGLRRQYDTSRIRLEPLEVDADISVLNAVPGIDRIESAGDRCEIYLRDAADPLAAMRSAASLVPPARIEFARLRLEDVFIRLVTGSTGNESNDALRANLQGVASEGAAG